MDKSVTYQVSRKTLCSVEGSKLESVFKDTESKAQDSEGVYHLQQDRDSFNFMINYLNSGRAMRIPENQLNTLTDKMNVELLR